MYIYLLKNKEVKFLHFIKEIGQSDDIILDRNIFNAHKIKLLIQPLLFSTIANHFLSMPEETTVTHQIENPGKEYILCIGEVNEDDFFVFYKKIEQKNVALITRQPRKVRVHIWVHYNDIYSLFASKVIHSFTTIGGQISERVWVRLECEKKKHSEIREKVFTYSDECIIKDRQIYVKCLTHEFSTLIGSIIADVNHYEIVDEDLI